MNLEPTTESASEDVIGITSLERAQEALEAAMAISADVATDAERSQENRDIANALYYSIAESSEWLTMRLADPEYDF